MDLSFPEKLRAEGRAEGHTQGQRQLLAHQLERRFGPLSGSVRQRLERIQDAEELLRLSERLLVARSLDDLGLAT